MTAITSAGSLALGPAGPLLVVDSLADDPFVAALLPGAGRRVVSPHTLRVITPWEGPLFDLFDELLAGTDAASDPVAVSGGPPEAANGDLSDATRVLGMVVPVVWTASGPAPEVVLISDHVNLTLRGPLCGRRPQSGPPVFPSMGAVYQPSLMRSSVVGRVYSEVAVAGVADAGRLTPFERQALTGSDCPAVCDCLVDTVIVAALHGLQVAACGIPRAA